SWTSGKGDVSHTSEGGQRLRRRRNNQACFGNPLGHDRIAGCAELLNHGGSKSFIPGQVAHADKDWCEVLVCVIVGGIDLDGAKIVGDGFRPFTPTGVLISNHVVDRTTAWNQQWQVLHH